MPDDLNGIFTAGRVEHLKFSYRQLLRQPFPKIILIINQQYFCRTIAVTHRHYILHC